MPIVDYAAIDEGEYYGQSFESEGLVSVWVGETTVGRAEGAVDILQDYCGVGYYSVDLNEVVSCAEPRSIVELVSAMSFARTFVSAVEVAAQEKGVSRACWVVAQYDFAYDPGRVRRPLHADAVFLGVFGYRAE